MQLVHTRGWRLLQLAHIDGDDLCHRLCRDRNWIGDFGSRDLPGQLAARNLPAEEFTVADADCCVMVDPSSRIACLRRAEPVDGHAHLPLCAPCRQTLTTMLGFPRQPLAHKPAAALPSLNIGWLNLGDEQDLRELSHHFRHPVAKILGWAEILHDDDTVSPMHTRQLGVIYQCAKDLQRLLNTTASPL